MRLIDADALIEANGLQGMEKGKADWAEYETRMLYEIKDMIDDAPTINTVQVVQVRCKDCDYAEFDELLDYGALYKCRFWDGDPTVGGDDFCSYGVSGIWKERDKK